MTALAVYRDDGPLARALGAALGRAVPAGELLLTVLGAAVVAVVLALVDVPLPGLLVVAAVAVGAAVAAAGADRPHTGAMSWLVPPLLRVLEYGVLIRLTDLAEPGAMPACFAFLGALAFHQYDTVYRLRHQKVGPPAWIMAIGGGWEGRLLVAAVLAAAGALGPGLVVAAIVLGLVYVTEAALSWARYAQAERRPVTYEDDDDEDVQDA